MYMYLANIAQCFQQKRRRYNYQFPFASSSSFPPSLLLLLLLLLLFLLPHLLLRIIVRMREKSDFKQDAVW